MPATACACDVLHITGALLPISHRAFDISMRSGGCFFFLFAPGEYCVSYPQQMSTVFLTHVEVLVSFISVSFKRALGVLSIVYCLLARSCLGVRAARCVVAPGVPLERRESRDGKSLDLTRMHGSGKLMRVLQAGCRGRSRRRPTHAPWC